MTPVNLNAAQQMLTSKGDREPIHIPGSIQPHGVLLVLQEPDLRILQVSQNVTQFLGITPQALLNQTLTALLGNQSSQLLNNCLNGDFEHINPLKLSWKTAERDYHFNGIFHRFEDLIILELELNSVFEKEDFFKFYQMTKNIILKIQKANSLIAMSQILAEEVRTLTEFDRVMIYRFAEDASGQVIAESKRENLVPYLGLNYPSLDIPQSARKLFQKNILRFIPDVNYQPVELPVRPDTQQPIDLSLAFLRAASPCHLQYLKNMGVRGSMTISLTYQNILWGLVACHHYTPQYLAYETRTACEFLGRVMSSELGSKQDYEDLESKVRIKTLSNKLFDALVIEEDWGEGLAKVDSHLLRLVSASGAAILQENRLILVGKTPSESTVFEIAEWVKDQLEGDLFYTHSLAHLEPKFVSIKETASGLLVLSLTRIQANLILWFRPEILQTVNWAGNPDSNVKVEADGSLTLSPRTSFTLWKETVKLKSWPWQKAELEAAIDLKSTIVGLVLRKAEELAQLNLDLQRSNSELDAFTYIASHDLKEPLRGIHNYANFLLEDYTNVLNEEGTEMLQTLVRLTQRMENLLNALLHYSRLGRAELAVRPIDWKTSLANIREVFDVSQPEITFDIRVPRPLPAVEGDPVLIEEALRNLIANAVKYNDQENKWVEIGWLTSQEAAAQRSEANLIHWLERSPDTVVLYIKDNGIGIDQKHQEVIFQLFRRLHGRAKYGGGTGAGLTIVKKILERHGGKIWVESSFGEGSTFYFTLNRFQGKVEEERA